MKSARRILPLILVIPIALAGCASSKESNVPDQAAIDKARAEGIAQEKARQAAAAEKVKQRELMERIRRLEEEQKARRQKAAAPPAAPAPAPAPASTGSSCGGNLSVGPNTSCSFAQEVYSAWSEAGGGTTSVEAYSPVTNRVYTMYCTAGAPTVCRGGNNAVVYIR